MESNRPTEKQVKARTRNWHIRQLRAYWHLCPCHMSEETKNKIHKIIDKELKQLGAESETDRVERRYKEMLGEES